MTPFWSSDNGETTLRLYQGHVLDVLRAMPAESVHMICTSPPYWGLRDYQLEPQVWGGLPACRCEEAEIACSTCGGCAHYWDERRWYTEQSAAGSSGEAFNEAGDGNAKRLQQARWRSDATCLRCGAWRGSLGLEPTPDLYVQHLVEVFREVRRVLRWDGTLWLNMGDAYHNGDKGGYQNSRTGPDSLQRSNLANDFIGAPNRQPQHGLKPKDLLGMPWRVAFALQADGWWLRSDIVWSKPNSMPESVTDRPTKSHEYLFLLTKSERYFYDADAIRESFLSSPSDLAKMAEGQDRISAKHLALDDSLMKASALTNIGRKRGVGDAEAAAQILAMRNGEDANVQLFGDRRQAPEPGEPNAFHPFGRNKRTVWEIATEPYSEAHFATFPQKLVEPCILAGTSARGCCPECGAPWERVTETEYRNDTTESGRPAEGNNIKGGEDQGARTFASGVRTRRLDTTLGWQPTCAHDAALIPCTVLDPFAGSGTTLLVAQRLGRHGVGIELSPEYCALAVKRLDEHKQQRLAYR